MFAVLYTVYHLISPPKILFITTLVHYKDKYSDMLDFLGTNKYIEKLRTNLVTKYLED